MSNQASTSDISSFLAQAKRLIAAGDYVFVPRGKNLQALSDHGLTVKDAKDEMLGLMVGDYFKGPKIQNRNGKDVLKCLSFHEDDYS